MPEPPPMPANPNEPFTEESAAAWARFIVDSITEHYRPLNQDHLAFARTDVIAFHVDAILVIRTVPENTLMVSLRVPNGSADKYKPCTTFFAVVRDLWNTHVIKTLLGPKDALETMYRMHNMMYTVVQDYHDNLVDTRPVTPVLLADTESSSLS